MSTLQHYGTLFPTAVVGSMPRSDFVRELVLGDKPDPEALDKAVAYVIALQERAGLDIISDGEWRRASYIGVIAELAHGFEIGTNPADGRPWTVVTAPLTAKNPGFIAAETAFVKDNTRARIKATIPSPGLLAERLWDADKSADAYPKREDFAKACVPFLRREIELLRDAGADLVQIDDPHLCLLVDPEVRAGYTDPDAEADLSTALVNEMIEGIDGVRLALHLCRRAGARVRGEACHNGGYGPILPYLNRLKVHHLTMEFTAAGADDAEVFRELRDDFEIGLGVVDVQPGAVDAAETVAARVETALRHLDPERVVLNPDCGFAPGSAARVDMDEVYLKLKNQTEAAALLRRRYG
jgi:5-methyltetrahydropteroyltriglutamate--homocysteine methyltransferase